jgi:hypothetical protein
MMASSLPDENTAMFGRPVEPRYGEPSGAINRFTGETSIHIMTLTNGVYRFAGTCKRAQKLF